MRKVPVTEIFMDFDFSVNSTGVQTYTLRCAELPRGFYCRINANPEGRGICRTTQANGKGSRRYHYERSIDEAMDAARKWAIRKIREARRETK